VGRVEKQEADLHSYFFPSASQTILRWHIFDLGIVGLAEEYQWIVHKNLLLVVIVFRWSSTLIEIKRPDWDQKKNIRDCKLQSMNQVPIIWQFPDNYLDWCYHTVFERHPQAWYNDLNLNIRAVDINFWHNWVTRAIAFNSDRKNMLQ
jgi:hypothetical protein